ncbi:3-deoxy-D-manno-octulosonic acid transferase [Chloroherpeton thalassium]|uniref:3-deoxy-D-manno-octulosonic acid transferase n=1 Tax=Chloroherpeton thalassium TaxID=100716 RepID=UPI001FDFDAA1|nr:glycosyltransferase N-terminal domain-containing protein [Chloroherpeton thalassium]
MKILGFFNAKIRATLLGRENLFQRIRAKQKALTHKSGFRLWVHAASVGEFEQARPIVKAIREKDPDAAIILTFLSVSGYEARKNTKEADLVTYLPADTPSNARKFLDLLQPDALLLMRYDFWPNHLFEAKRRGIYLMLAAAVLQPDSTYNKPIIRGFYQTIFSLFDQIFTVAEDDAKNFKTLFGLDRVQQAGEPRIDQVIWRSQQQERVAHLKPIYNERLVLVAGSVWKTDEAHLIPAYQSVREKLLNYPISLILVPHEIGQENLNRMADDLKSKHLSYQFISRLHSNFNTETVLIIDEIGYLAELYSLAHIAYIGGGFGVHVHNTLEAAVYHLPLIYGPHFHKSPEAKAFQKLGGATVVSNTQSLEKILYDLFSTDELREKMGKIAGNYVHSRAGATQKIAGALLPAQKNAPPHRGNTLNAT